MNTKFSSYIQYHDFETLITSCFPSEKASIIDKSLHDNFIIVPRGKKFMAYEYHIQLYI